MLLYQRIVEDQHIELEELFKPRYEKTPLRR